MDEPPVEESPAEETTIESSQIEIDIHSICPPPTIKFLYLPIVPSMVLEPNQFK